MLALDHIVMPFDTLDAARAWFGRLGFLVAPTAIHPFGTGNACLFFADGRFLEPLAVADPSAYRVARDEGSAFVVRDAAMRQVASPPAISAVAFKTDDARADRDRLLAVGCGEEALFDFERVLTLPDGSRTQLAFRLAFASMFAAGAPSFFFCETRHAGKPDRSSLIAHPNGATGILGATFFASDPGAAGDYLARVADSEIASRSDGSMRLPLEGGSFDLAGEGTDPLSIETIDIGVGDLAFARDFWHGRGVEFTHTGDTVAIACPNGRGVIRFLEDRS